MSGEAGPDMASIVRKAIHEAVDRFVDGLLTPEFLGQLAASRPPVAVRKTGDVRSDIRVLFEVVSEGRPVALRHAEKWHLSKASGSARLWGKVRHALLGVSSARFRFGPGSRCDLLAVRSVAQTERELMAAIALAIDNPPESKAALDDVRRTLDGRIAAFWNALSSEYRRVVASGVRQEAKSPPVGSLSGEDAPVQAPRTPDVRNNTSVAASRASTLGF